MDELKFKSIEDIYRKLTPALNTKVSSLKRNNIHHIKERDIWNYLKREYWPKREHLSLGEIVNDILSTPASELENYVNSINQKPKKELKPEELL